ncbi:hypothetical protein IQ255_08790 [Pleurocapsales cyanobacterium LEGE 10410]|nr:hypothetical protein [Pleurocapsales cyanobacterium LEGE 10410]
MVNIFRVIYSGLIGNKLIAISASVWWQTQDVARFGLPSYSNYSGRRYYEKLTQKKGCPN